MLGPDTERMLSIVCKINDVTNRQIDMILRDSADLCLAVDSEEEKPSGASTGSGHDHTHDERYFTKSQSDARYASINHTHKETSKPLEVEPVIRVIISSYSDLDGDIVKIRDLGKDAFNSTDKINNSYGSPWKEFENLEASIDILNQFHKVYSVCEYINEKMALSMILNKIICCAIDLKWALIKYNDMIQDAYDRNYNDGEKSIQFQTGINTYSTGNVDQDMPDGTVSIPKQSIDPF